MLESLIVDDRPGREMEFPQYSGIPKTTILGTRTKRKGGRAGSIEEPTSNIQHPTSNIQRRIAKARLMKMRRTMMMKRTC
jgi:hypothetical protein